MKDKKLLISWFIGVGCGLFFSGIALSIILYTSNKEIPMPKEQQSQVAPAQTKQALDNLAIERNTQSHQPIEKEIIETKEIPQEDNIKKEAEIKTLANQSVEINIHASATAHDITRMLVENGVISDYDGFIALVVSKDAERKLAHGTRVFPLNSDIETVFKLLRP